MVLGHGHRRHSLSSNRSSIDETHDNSTITGDDETVVDSEQSNGTPPPQQLLCAPPQTLD